MKNNLIVPFVIALIVSIGVVAIAPKSVEVIDKTETVEVEVGSRPILNSKYFNFGNVTQYREKATSLNSATTTVCALSSPSATSTLISATVKLTTSSTTASRLTLAKASTAFATTSALAEVAVSANSQVTLTATNTANYIFSPNTYVVAGMAGGVGTFSPEGVCQATWEAI